MAEVAKVHQSWALAIFINALRCTIFYPGKGGVIMFNIDKNKVKHANLFAAGLALGTVGLKVLTSKDAKKVYANVVAAGIRAKDSIMQTAEKVQASSDSILADAQEINEKRRQDEALFEEEESDEK